MIPINNMDRIFKEPILNRLEGIRHITYKELNPKSLLVRNFFKVVKKVLIPSRQNINDRVLGTI